MGSQEETDNKYLLEKWTNETEQCFWSKTFMPILPEEMQNRPERVGELFGSVGKEVDQRIKIWWPNCFIAKAPAVGVNAEPMHVVYMWRAFL